MPDVLVARGRPTFPAASLDGNLPEIDENDPAQIEALFGNYGHWEHWRKVVQAQCEELVRAKFALAGEKITEHRLEVLARLHDNYISFLTDGLQGRRLREQNVLAVNSGRYGA